MTGAAGPAAGLRTPAPRFSVILNIYNGDEFVAEAIDSVIAQSCSDWELIIWDDCSSDRSGEICRAYCSPRIHYFRSSQNTGVGAARNEAVRRAAGDWLAFLDQDDIWLSHKLAAQSALIEQDEAHDLALVYGRTTRFDRHGRTSAFDRWHGPGRLPEGDIFIGLLRKPSFIAFSSAVIRRDVFIELGGIPANIVYCPDYYLSLAIARRYRSACVQELCCLYRLHPSSMSHRYRKEINFEALRIIEMFATSAQQRILLTRRWVHETWIGVEEISVRGTRQQGALRILRKGSLLYLALRPFVICARELRHWLNGPAVTHQAIGLARSLGMLKWADGVRFGFDLVKHRRRNAEFIRAYPKFPVPPADMAFNALNHVDWTAYLESGRSHAAIFASVIRETVAHRSLAILEWGCGPGRIIRHMRQAMAGCSVTLTGSDNSERAVSWCHDHLPDIDFIVNGDIPPLALRDEQFDVIYNFSVFTHLSEDAQIAWTHELYRLLKPGGLLICSTHGDRHRHLLARQDAVRYDQGQMVVQKGYAEGTKWFLTIHPPRLVREQLLREFEDVRPAATGLAMGMSQDLWIARKPASPMSASVTDLEAIQTSS